MLKQTHSAVIVAFLVAGMSGSAAMAGQGFGPPAMQDFGPPQVKLARGKLQPNTLYAIETRCSPGSQPLPSAAQVSPIASFFHNLLPGQSAALTQVVEVTTSDLTGIVDPKNSNIASLVSMVLPFSVDTSAAHNIILDNTTGCDANYLIENPKGLFLTSSWSVATTTNPGVIATAFKSAVDVATSLAPVVAGVALGKNPTQNLAGVEGALNSLQTLFQTLFPGDLKNPQQSSPLLVGTSTIITPFSKVAVTVRPIVSIVGDQNKVYFNDFNTEIGKLKYSSADSCVTAQNMMAQDGFTSQDDQAYGIGRLALNALTTKPPLAQCLGLTGVCHAAIAAKMDGLLWKGFNPQLKPTSEECDEVVPPGPPASIQPPYTPQLTGFLKNLTILFTEYGSRPSPALDFSQRLSLSVATLVALDDRTSLHDLGNQTFPDPVALLAQLKLQGYTTYGCFAPTDDVTAAAFGSVASFVGGKGPNPLITDAIALFPQFENGVVKKFVVSNGADDINASIGKQGSCTGVRIKAGP
jgi:hypothetical protein